MGEGGGQRKAEGRHESFFHSYTIPVINVIIYTESPFPSPSKQGFAPKPKLKPKFLKFTLECAKPA